MRKLLKEVKNQSVIIILGIFNTLYSFISCLYLNKINFYISILIFIIIICLYSFHKKLYWRIRLNFIKFPQKLNFMLDFIKNTDEIKNICSNKYKNNQLVIEDITTTFVINGQDITTSKTFNGHVIKGICDRLIMCMSAGSSTSHSNIGVKSYYWSEIDNKFILSELVILEEKERTKICSLSFGKVKSKNERFLVKFCEDKWIGAMRLNYDGCIISDQNFFNNIISQTIILKFENINTETLVDIQVYKFNYINGTIEKISANIIRIGEQSYKWQSLDNDNGCLYLLMYEY